jgi:hypothetical protein
MNKSTNVGLWIALHGRDLCYKNKGEGDDLRGIAAR